MDLVSSCRDKLAHFRIKELKDVLTQLGLAKQGKKQDLVDRILNLLSDENATHGWGRKVVSKETVAKVVDDTYRKMQNPGATDLASRSHSNPDYNNNIINAREQRDDYSQKDNKVRCCCGSTLKNDSMIMCEEPKCRVWQHINCVIVPEKPLEGVQPELPQQFYCELCRINKADPFWVTLSHPLLPVKLMPSTTAPDGTIIIQNTDRTFQLARADRELLQRPDYDLQVWCLLLNDKVSFRMQWPQHADLQVNGVPVRTTNRPGSQLLGINGRDDGPVITTCSREGMNKISLTRTDARVFCFGIRIAKRRTVPQVLSLIPRESDGEVYEDALARVRRCIGGTAPTDNADSDSDLEVVAESVTVNLRCPMSGCRMKIAGRFKPCIHMGCFDLETFVELNQRSRKWQCPVCLKNYSLEHIIIDPYFNRITSLLRSCGEDVDEIDVKPDGSWRAKNERDTDLGRWHLPDGSLVSLPKSEVKSEPDLLKEIRQDGMSDGRPSLKLGIKKNRNGFWEVSKPEDGRQPSPINHVPDKFETHVPNVIPMSSSVSECYRNGEDPSVNQDGGGHFDLSVTNQEIDSVPWNTGGATTALGDTDVIVLSDSEDDNGTMLPVYNNEPNNNTGNVFSSTHHGIPQSFAEDTGLGNGLGFFENGEGDDFATNLWPQTGLQLFSTDPVAPDAFVDVPQNSLGCSPINGFGLIQDGGIGDGRSNNEINGGLVDNPLGYGGSIHDPSLQIFLPTQPSGPSSLADVNEQNEATHGIRSDDWISLRLGGTETTHIEPTTTNMNCGHTFVPSSDVRAEQLSDPDAASLLLSMNDDRTNKAVANVKRSDGPFSPPRQPRSVRPRLYLSIDSDSD